MFNLVTIFNNIIIQVTEVGIPLDLKNFVNKIKISFKKLCQQNKNIISLDQMNQPSVHKLFMIDRLIRFKNKRKKEREIRVLLVWAHSMLDYNIE